MVTVILPSAGYGTRLGAPFSKELLPVGPRQFAIDQFLETAIECHDVDEVLVIVRKGKNDLLAHLRACWSDRISVTPVYQPEESLDSWADGVLAARDQFGSKNIVFLPDTVISGMSPSTLVEQLACYLDDGPVAFAACPIENVPWARSAGALAAYHADSTRVQRYEEHPQKVQDFSHVWVALAFRKEGGIDVLRTMAAMKRGGRQPGVSLQRLGIIGARLLEVNGYHDLGTWASYVRYMRSSDVVI